MLRSFMQSTRRFSIISWLSYKVTVIGGAGGIGQPLCLLLKLNPLVTQLCLFDLAKIVPGVGIDLSHINTSCKVYGYQGDAQLAAAVSCSHVVVIPAGVPRKPGMSRDDLFNVNASIVFDCAQIVARHAPTACTCIITNPVNAVVPIAAEAMKMAGWYDPCKLFGVTTLDIVRASTFIGQINCCDPACVYIPCIGGHAGETIIPVLSQGNPRVNLCTQNDLETLTKRIQNAGTEVVKAKAGGGSATLSMAYAASRFVTAVLRGLNGEKGVCECAYVQSCVTKSPFFANTIRLGPCGMDANMGLGCLNSYEMKQVTSAVSTLQKSCAKGREFANQYSAGCCDKGKGRKKK